MKTPIPHTPLAVAARAVAAAGRKGDTVLVHMSPEEFEGLKGLWGEPTINPVTGVPEYFKLGNVFRALLPVATAVAAPFLAPAIGGALGLSGPLANIVGSGLLGAGAGGITGGGKGALYGGLAGGALSAIAPVLGNTFANIAPETAGKFGITGGADTIFGGGTSLFGNTALTSPLTQAQTLATQSGATIGGAGLSGASPTTFSPDPGVTVGGGMSAVANAPSAMSTPTFDFGSRLTDPGVQSVISSGGANAAANAANQGSWLSRNWMPVAAGGLGLAALSGMDEEPSTEGKVKSPIDQGPYSQPLNLTDDREALNVNMTVPEWYTYGQRPEQLFFKNNRVPVREAAQGGLMQMSSGSYVPSQGHGGQDDKIPAMLSDGEYVIDATTVADLGDGNSEAGAKKLDKLRDEVAKHKGRRERVPPKAHNSPLQYLKKVG